jgi:hypothetical protein
VDFEIEKEHMFCGEKFITSYPKDYAISLYENGNNSIYQK